MPDTLDHNLKEAVLDSWDRNNTILVNLLGAIKDDEVDLTAIPGSSSIADMFTHMHFCRLLFVRKNVPEFSRDVPRSPWPIERDRQRLADMLNESAKVVREAVKARMDNGRAMDRDYDHPILFLQHMIWHEGYHHGQIKLALKAAGRPLDDEEIGQVTWDVWMDKTR